MDDDVYNLDTVDCTENPKIKAIWKNKWNRLDFGTPKSKAFGKTNGTDSISLP
jgi:hypothetical protein